MRERHTQFTVYIPYSTVYMTLTFMLLVKSVNVRATTQHLKDWKNVLSFIQHHTWSLPTKDNTNLSEWADIQCLIATKTALHHILIYIYLPVFFVPYSFFAVLFGQFVVFQTLPSDVVEIYDGSSTDSALLSSIYGSHSGKNITLGPLNVFIYATDSMVWMLLSNQIKLLFSPDILKISNPNSFMLLRIKIPPSLKFL